MNLQSDDFTGGNRLPDRHAYGSDNQSPALKWTGLPDGTKELAIICDDPDAPVGTWVHWVIYGIHASIGKLERGVAKNPELKEVGGAKQGKNDFGQVGYDGPHPPPGRPHRYFFRFFALSESLGLGPGATATQLRKAMQGKILAEQEIVGMYSR